MGRASAVYSARYPVIIGVPLIVLEGGQAGQTNGTGVKGFLAQRVVRAAFNRPFIASDQASHVFFLSRQRPTHPSSTCHRTLLCSIEPVRRSVGRLDGLLR